VVGWGANSDFNAKGQRKGVGFGDFMEMRI